METTNQFCTACGYDLQQLGAGTVCPECGSPVIGSGSMLLRYADASWLDQVYRGFMFLRVSQGAIILTMCLQVIVAIAGMILLDPATDTSQEAALEAARVIVFGLLMLGCLGLLAGLWMSFAPDPSRRDDGHRAMALLAGPVNLLVLPAIGLADMAISRSAWNQAVWRHAIVHFAFVLGWIGVVLIVHRAIVLTRRTQNCSADQHHRLAGFITLALIAPGVLAALTWLGPLRWIAAGDWQFPTDKTYKPLLMSTAFVWFLATFALTGAKRAVHSEIAARNQLRSLASG